MFHYPFNNTYRLLSQRHIIILVELKYLKVT